MGIKLIIGLGNPGDKYDATRHNAGFQFVHFLLQGNTKLLKPNKKLHGLVADLTTNYGTDCNPTKEHIKLLLPQTYMNQSGLAVAAAVRYFNLTTDQLLIAHDELDLSPGTAKIKYDGGHGGHNGLRHTFQTLGKTNFYRLRIGIGHPGDKNKVLNYVLKSAGKKEQALIDQAIYNASQSLELMVKGDAAKAMQTLNSKHPD